MDAKQLLKKHPGLKKCIEEQVIHYENDYLMCITTKHLDETQLDKIIVKRVIDKYLQDNPERKRQMLDELGIK